MLGLETLQGRSGQATPIEKLNCKLYQLELWLVFSLSLLIRSLLWCLDLVSHARLNTFSLESWLFRNFSFLLRLLSTVNVELDWDRSALNIASWLVEAKIELVESTIRLFLHTDGHSSLVGFESVDFLLNWDVYRLDWHILLHNIWVESEVAAFLPRPMRIVLNFDFVLGDSTSNDFVNDVRIRHDFSTT